MSTISRARLRRRPRAPASRRPCRRCWDRRRRRRRACGPARAPSAATVAPSVNASSETLRALEVLLDDAPCAPASPKRPSKHSSIAATRRVDVHRDRDALARGEAVGLHDDRRADARAMYASAAASSVNDRLGPWGCPRRSMQVLRERLASPRAARRSFPGPNTRIPRASHDVGDAGDERSLRADDDEVDVVRGGPVGDRRAVLDVQARHVLGDERRAAVTRGARRCAATRVRLAQATPRWRARAHRNRGREPSS